jgi:diacylglycerol O-acyltransferase / wax synthase
MSDATPEYARKSLIANASQKRKESLTMKQLTPLDSNFFYFEAPNQPMMLGSLWVCDQSTAPGGIVRHKQILQYIDDRLRSSSIFRRRLQEPPMLLDEPYWLEDKNFDIEYHVHHVGLPQPGDWRQLCIFTARTMARSVDMSRAPWEIYLIEGLNNVEGVSPGSFAVLIRFHHAYVDGQSSLALSVAMMEETPQHESKGRNQVQFYENPPTKTEMWLRTLPRLISRSQRMLRAGFDVAVKSAELFARQQRDDALKPVRAPKTIFNSCITAHRTYGAYNWTLPELKRICALVSGASLDDGMIAIIAGGMRRYLLRHDALPSKESLISMCPVALRQEDTHYEGGNLISAMHIRMGTDIEDPVTRLEAVQRRTAAQIPLAKEVLYHLTNSAGDLYPAYMRAFFAWLHNKTQFAARHPIINTVITNVPGVPGLAPKYFAGAKILSVHPFLPISDGIAINHAITGIYDQVSLGVVADRAIVPDIDFYIECIAKSTREYLERLEAVENEQRVTVISAQKTRKPKPIRTPKTRVPQKQPVSANLHAETVTAAAAAFVGKQ